MVSMLRCISKLQLNSQRKEPVVNKYHNSIRCFELSSEVELRENDPQD